MRLSSILLVPLALCSTTSAFALTVAADVSSFSTAQSHTRVGPSNSLLMSADLRQYRDHQSGLPRILVAETQTGIVGDDAGRSLVEHAAPSSSKPVAVEASLSVPPDDVAARCDIGGPYAKGSTPTSGPVTGTTPDANHAKATAGAFDLATQSPAVAIERAASQNSDGPVLTAPDSMGPVRQDQLASLDLSYIPSKPAPIVPVEKGFVPSVIRQHRDERPVTYLPLREPVSKPSLRRPPLATKPIARPPSIVASSKPVFRPHLAQVALRRPTGEASTSVSEAAQIAGLRAMERMN